MSFNIALSGVSAAQKDLDTTANNIANVNTTGFKESRAEFADVYASSLLANGKTKVGDGVLTAEVAQQFSQGSLKYTNNALDLAITGNGFFTTVSDITSQDYTYTRAGEFKLDEDNYVVNSTGNNLLGFPVNDDGSSASVSLSTAEPVRIPDSSGSPQATSEVDIGMNLPAGESALDPDDFDPEDSSTYNAATSVTVYDSLGESHIQTFYFIKDSGATNEWVVATAVDGQMVDIADSSGADVDPTTAGIDSVGVNTGNHYAAGRLVFDSTGDFTSVLASDGAAMSDDKLITEQLGVGILSNGSDSTQQLSIDFNLDTDDEPTQYASAFEVNNLEQNGLAVGQLSGIEIDDTGLVTATYSNGTTEPIIRIALVKFANEQGLTQVGNTSWKESVDSGEALAGEAGAGEFGKINSSTLEQSNVNLTSELIDMIIAQRNFQANSKALEVNNQLNQTILNIG